MKTTHTRLEDGPEVWRYTAITVGHVIVIEDVPLAVSGVGLEAAEVDTADVITKSDRLTHLTTRSSTGAPANPSPHSRGIAECGARRRRHRITGDRVVRHVDGRPSSTRTTAGELTRRHPTTPPPDYPGTSMEPS
jgi:hypothetical protein